MLYHPKWFILTYSLYYDCLAILQTLYIEKNKMENIMDCVVLEQITKESVQIDLRDWFYNAFYVSFDRYWNIDFYGTVFDQVNVYHLFFACAQSRAWILNISWDMYTWYWDTSFVMMLAMGKTMQWCKDKSKQQEFTKSVKREKKYLFVRKRLSSNILYLDKASFLPFPRNQGPLTFMYSTLLLGEWLVIWAFIY